MLIFPYIHLLAALVRMDGCFIRLNRHILNFKKWPKHQNASECWSQIHIPPGKDNLIGPGGYLFTQASRQPWDSLRLPGTVSFHFQISTSLSINFPSIYQVKITLELFRGRYLIYFWFPFDFVHPEPERTKIGRLAQGEASFRRVGGSATLYSKLPAPRPNTTERLFSFWNLKVRILRSRYLCPIFSDQFWNYTCITAPHGSLSVGVGDCSGQIL